MAQEFSARFARHKDELEWLFMELYNNREGLEVLEREMADAYDARSAELKALDKARAADPNWYKRGNMFGMTMYTDLFAGNLKELAKKLPYFKEQKLTYLHLMPLLQMSHPPPQRRRLGLFNFTEYPARASLDALGGNYRTADGQSIWLADVELEPYQALLVRR